MRIGVLGVTRIACTCGARQAGSLPNRKRVKRATLFGSILISASAGISYCAQAEHARKVNECPTSFGQSFAASSTHLHNHNMRGRSALQAAKTTEWSLAPSKGDGRCLFRSLAQGDHRLRNEGRPLPDNKETEAADLVRDQVCDQLLKLRDDLSPFIDEDFDAYVANMRQPHVWGGEPELSVAADVLKRPVHVYDNRLQPVTQYSPRETSDDDRIRQPIFLLFQHLGHYDLLLKHDLTARSKL